MDKQHVYQKSQHQNATFYASRIVQSYELHDDNRLTQSNAHFLMPKIKLSFSVFNLRRTILRILCWYSSIEQSDLSSLNSLNKNEHYKSASQNIQNGHNPTMKHSKTSLMAKVPSKINNFEGLEKVCHKFSQTFLWKRHDTPHQKPRQRTISKISLLIEYGRARFVTHIVTHHT